MRDPVLNRPLFRRAFQQGGDVQSTLQRSEPEQEETVLSPDPLPPVRPFPIPWEAGADFQLGPYFHELGSYLLSITPRRGLPQRSRPAEEAFPVDQETMREQMRLAAEEAERGRVPKDEATVISEQRTAAAQRSEQEVSTPLDPLRQAYERRAALYGEIYGDPDQRRQEAKTRILLEVAERGLALAGGRTPEGQPTTGSFVSQAAQAFAGLPRTIGAEAAAITEQDRAMRMAQLQAAEAEAEIMIRAMLEPQAAGMPALPVMQTPEELPEWLENLDLSKAFGTGAVFGNWANKFLGFFGARPSDEDRQTAITEINAFNNRILGNLGRGLQKEGRLSVFVLQLSQGLLPQPTEFLTSPFKARAEYQAILNRLRTINKENYKEYNLPGTTDKRKEELYREYINGMAGQAELEALLTQFDRSLGQTDPLNVSQFIRESQ